MIQGNDFLLLHEQYWEIHHDQGHNRPKIGKQELSFVRERAGNKVYPHLACYNQVLTSLY